MLAALPRSLRSAALRRRCFHQTCFAFAKTTQTFKLADIGEGITECEIIKWNVQPSATVAHFDPLCEVQSDKASVEITSPFDGVIKQLLVQEGEVAKVGSGLCLIEVEDDAVDEVSPSESSHTEPEPDPRPTQQLAQQVVEQEPPQQKQRKPHPLDPSSSQSQSSSDNENKNKDVLATPSTRHFAMRSGITDLSVLAPGSGKGGRIEKGDVEAYLASGSSGSESSSSGQTSVERGKDVVVELGRTRYGMWKAMEKSLQIPHFTYSTSLDLTAFHALLPSINDGIPGHYLPEEKRPSLDNLLVNAAAVHPLRPASDVHSSARFTKVTYLSYLMKALSRAMVEWPLFRSSITPGSTDGGNRPSLTLRDTTDIALALSTPSGLYVPTLQDVERMSVYDVQSWVRDVGWRGRQQPHQLTPTDLSRRGGTVTLSNVGAIGQGEYASPVLVEGCGVAICAVGRAKWELELVSPISTSTTEEGEEEVIELGKGVKARRRLKVGVSWSADHRVVEGAEMAAFVECWRGWVESPGRGVGGGV